MGWIFAPAAGESFLFPKLGDLGEVEGGVVLGDAWERAVGVERTFNEDGPAACAGDSAREALDDDADAVVKQASASFLAQLFQYCGILVRGFVISVLANSNKFYLKIS
jgi:hypothetical protein